MRTRLDQLLVERGLVESRARAQALIRAGEVTVGDVVFDKPGMLVAADAAIVLRARVPFVGRGGGKLAAALDGFGLDPRGLACLDVGASTGGFTDALLQRGAARVYAVDVGRGQLAWSLRTDPRVVNMERTDIRAVSSLPEPIDLATVDVAFISLRLVLPAVRRLLADTGRVIALVKPQFEAGRQQVPRGGVVRDPAVHHAVMSQILSWAQASGWRIADARPSPIFGAAGNREFLAHLTGPSAPEPALAVADAVARALAEQSDGLG